MSSFKILYEKASPQTVAQENPVSALVKEKKKKRNSLNYRSILVTGTIALCDP